MGNNKPKLSNSQIATLTRKAYENAWNFHASRNDTTNNPLSSYVIEGLALEAAIFVPLNLLQGKNFENVSEFSAKLENIFKRTQIEVSFNTAVFARWVADHCYKSGKIVVPFWHSEWNWLYEIL